MDKRQNSYYQIACDDLLYAEALMDISRKTNKFNGVASMCAQSAEKFMKAFIESELIDIDVALLRTHNLRKLLDEIKTYYNNCDLSEESYKWLGDYYFDARYPGDDYVIVKESHAIKCILLVNQLKDWIDLNIKEKPAIGIKKMSEFTDNADM